MSELTGEALDDAARALMKRAGQPTRRVRPRLAGPLNPAEEIELETPDGPVMAWRLGEGPATLLVHGWEDDNALWGPFIDQCQQLGRAVVALDLPGHGFTRTEFTTIDAAARAIAAVAQALGPIDSLVAHSFGCAASLKALQDGLDIPRAVMIAAPLPPTGDRESFGEKRLRRAARDDEAGAVLDRAIALARIQAQTSVHPQQVIAEAIPRVGAKGLIIHAFDDDQCPVGNSQAMAGLWPNSRLILVDDLGHRLIAQDAVVLQQVLDFVDDYG